MLDWKKNISSTEFFEKYRDWDKVENEEIPVVLIEIRKGIDTSSREMAITFDDISKGKFYYRDYTKNGLPFVEEKEVYWSTFSFEYLEDAKKFAEMFGVMGNWEPGYKEFCLECNNRRDGEA